MKCYCFKCGTPSYPGDLTFDVLIFPCSLHSPSKTKFERYVHVFAYAIKTNREHERN